MYQYKTPDSQYTIDLSIQNVSYSFSKYNNYVSMQVKDIMGIPICDIHMSEIEVLQVILTLLQFETLNMLNDRHTFIPDANGLMYSLFVALNYNRYQLSSYDYEHPEDDEAERYIIISINLYDPKINQNVNVCKFCVNVYELEELALTFYNLIATEGNCYDIVDIDCADYDEMFDFIIRKRQEMIIM